VESSFDETSSPGDPSPKNRREKGLSLMAGVAILLVIFGGSALVLIDFLPGTYFRTRSLACLVCNRQRDQKFYVSMFTGRICYSQRETWRSPLELQKEMGWGDSPHEHVWAHTYSDGHHGFLLGRSSGLHGRGPWVEFPQSFQDIATSVRTIAARDPEMARRIAQTILINPTRYWLSWFPEPEQAGREKDQEEFLNLLTGLTYSPPLDEGERRKFNRLLDEYSGRFLEF
jgi:hypothetical protein